MNYIVFDLEATCWEARQGRINETIEIGAVKLNSNYELIDEFVQFIQPIKHPQLSTFCTKLTSIQQNDVNNAPHFPIAIERFKNWININEPYVLCSWGAYDKNQFESDSQVHGLDATWVSLHINLKKQYSIICHLKRGVGMKRALMNENIPLVGTHHRGIDDAKNIAKIFVKHAGHWSFSPLPQ